MKKALGHKVIKIFVVLILMFLCMIGMVQYKRNRSGLQNNQQRYSVTFNIINNSNEQTFSWGEIFIREGLEAVDASLKSDEIMSDITISCTSANYRNGCSINIVLVANSEKKEFKSIAREFDRYISDEIQELADSEMGYCEKKGEMDYVISARLKSSEVKYGLFGALMGLCFGIAGISLGELFFEKNKGK